MHRNRTWIIGSSAEERIRNRTLPVEGGDGSTLSLDFTTGVLDPRLTFTRSSNATFINSSGLVEWAAANMLANSVLAGASGSTPPTGWLSSVVGGTPSFTTSGTSITISNNGSATRSRIYQNFGQGLAGVRVTVRFIVIANNTGGLGLAEVVGFSVGGSSGEIYTVNGVTRSPTYTAWGAGDVIILTCIPAASANVLPLFGVGVQGPTSTAASITIADVQMNPGSTPNPYVATTSTSTGYYAPRFDYDPTSIGTPRGLLIESSANNLLSYSEDFSNAAWTKSGTNGTMPPTGTAPDGTATSRILEENTTTYAKHSLERSQTISAGIHTFSVWLKEPSSNSRRYAHIQLADGQATAARYTIVVDVQTGTITASGATNGTAGAPTGTGHSITPYTGGWYRVTISMNHAASPSYPVVLLGDSASLFGGNNQPFYSATTPYKGLLVWGAQLETGSGASSYIPTGSSQGSRAADNCVTAISNLTGFNANQGTIYESWRDNTASDTTTVQEWAFAFGTSGANGCGVHISNSASGTFGLNGGVSNTGDAGPAGTYVLQGVNKAAIAIDVVTTSLRLSANGSAVSAGTNILGYNAAQTFALGQRNNNTRYLNGWISQFKYWPYVLPDAQLTTLTTL